MLMPCRLHHSRLTTLTLNTVSEQTLAPQPDARATMRDATINRFVGLLIERAGAKSRFYATGASPSTPNPPGTVDSV